MFKIKRRLSFFIDRKKELINANHSLHHFDKAERVSNLRKKANEEAEKFEKPLFEEFTVLVLVCPPTRRTIDPPNLYPTVKPLVDGLTDNNWWEDDDWTHMKRMSFEYGGLSERRGQKGDFQIILEIEEWEGD